jgi:uncharacterized protein (DUF885 family)
MSTVFQICDRLTDAYAELSPMAATFAGVKGHDHRWDDLSPDGEAAKAAFYARGVADLAPHLDDPDPVQAAAARVVSSHLDTELRRHESGHWRHDLNHLHSPFQSARDTFDVAPKEGDAAWDAITARLSGWGEMLDGYRASLQDGLDRGDVVAQRQVKTVIDQVRSVAGEDSRFNDLTAQAASGDGDEEAVAEAVSVARAASAQFADWLETGYLPFTIPVDACGRERYSTDAEYYLGMTLDLDETYEWGWSEVHRLLDEMRRTAAEIDPGRSVEEVIDLLDTDPARSSPGHDEFAGFVRSIQAEAVDQLDGDAFDVPPEIREVTVNIAPPGGSLGAWYHPPSEDLSRPGSIWYALGERERIPHWQEVATAYHEGFPGHHLQVGIAVLQREQLSRFHRLFVWYSGSGEGWALYAERLMDELGYFGNPDYRLGLLASQLFRSTRVVLDVGAHLQKRIPADAPLHPNETWDYDIAVDYMVQVGLQAPDVAESEVLRYLGLPGQAISYKVGEREILDIRSRAMAGAGYDTKDFHRRLLEAGAIRLDQLRERMA